MYSKCRAIDDALYIFENMVSRDVVTWNTMISGYPQHGLAQEAIILFEEMIKQELDDYSRIADHLGWAGLLLETRDFVENMPISPNAVIWGSLFFSSRLHGSVQFGIQAAEDKLLIV
ncbi:Pentatricopeptide repeat-containing protein [Glycine soja]|uniref:Pentatricopeptide repeat-containing protein n=1 Tax=Glycine soja TaxID=3848 RepID=A0A445F2L5_GLYSO|nr:Pentatricopeptide repeat-containing protein [Glycine soja]